MKSFIVALSPSIANPIRLYAKYIMSELSKTGVSVVWSAKEINVINVHVSFIVLDD